ncbi:MAG TPA: XdhC family protein [Burkholderiales bacterium]|nr:XdhC family protein [Burkholderiales bacterium]
MKELEAIALEAGRARAAGKPVALATVVSIDGSSYRLPGARMLIVDGKWTAGSISGGCLEDDVVLRANDAIARAEPAIARYDTTNDDDIVFGVGLGCKGIIDIFVEPMGAPSPRADFVEFAGSCLRERRHGTAATVIRASGAAPKAGSRLLVSDRGAITDIEDERFAAELRRVVTGGTGPARIVSVAVGSATADVFIEHIEPALPLVVFGAGHDAVPVVRLAKEIGWHVTLVDHRPAYATVSRFPGADRIVITQPAGVAKEVAFDDDTVALVMTHNYLRDRELLEMLLASPVQYIGLLGPHRRANDILRDLREKGVEPTADRLARLYAPVGLDIGSEGPAEVALSILAEMQAVVTQHRGGHLRERKKPIHQA